MGRGGIYDDQVFGRPKEEVQGVVRWKSPHWVSSVV